MYLNTIGAKKVLIIATVIITVKIGAEIMPLCKAKVAITSSVSPFGSTPQPTMTPSLKEPLLSITPIIVPAKVPIISIKANVPTKNRFDDKEDKLTFKPTLTKNNGIKKPKDIIYNECDNSFYIISFGFLIPLFFVSVGLNVSLS